MKPVILFDLDHTLFDTTTWYEEFIVPTFVEVLDVSAESIKEATKAYQSGLEKSTDFEPQAYLDFMTAEFEADRQVLEKVFFNHSHLEHSVFSEVKPVLHAMKGEYQLGLFSEGVEAFQRQKLELAGLDQLLDPSLIFIFRRKLESEALAQVSQATIIDDRLEVIEVLQTVEDLQPIWLNRRDSTRHHDVPTIHSLVALPKVLTGQATTPPY